MKISGYLLLACLFLGSCLTPETNLAGKKFPYFDLSGFILKMVQDSLQFDVEKSVTVDSQVESKFIDDYQIWEDIEQFDSYDINRPALFDKYQADTVLNGSLQELTYRPLEENLKVRLLKVFLEQNQVKQIMINTMFSSFLEDVTLDIDWMPKEGYEIHRSSDKLFGPTTNQVIKVKKR